jgi:hypothetical protein
LPGHTFSHQSGDVTEDFDINQPLFQFPQPLQKSGLSPPKEDAPANAKANNASSHHQGLSGRLVPPPPRQPEELEVEETEGDVTGDTGPGVTSLKEEVEFPVNKQVHHADPVKNEVIPSESSSAENRRGQPPANKNEKPASITRPFASYPGNPNQDWGHEYTDLRFPPFDNSNRKQTVNSAGQQGFDEGNKVTRPKSKSSSRPSGEVLIRATSNVSKNNQMQRNS